MDVSTRERGVFSFGRFRLDPVRRALLRDAAPIKLSARLFDTLLYLVQNHDRLVEHQELEQALWGGRTVEEGNLGKAVSSLRKALLAEDPAANFIVTVPGRGYRFAAPVLFEAEPTELLAPPVADPSAPEPPARNDMAFPSRHVRRGWRTPALAAIAVALAVLGPMAWRWHQAEQRSGAPLPTQATPAPFTPPPHSVAVMAFTNLSGDPAQEYFSDGLSEELIDALGRIGTLRVSARLSSFSFKGRAATVDEIARKLNVGTVLEGSLRRDGSRIRVTAQLIDAQTGYQLWSHIYDRDAGDIFKLQAEIAEAVAESLQVTLLGADTAKLTLGGTTNAAAFDAYLRAENTLHAGPSTEAAARQARAALDQALALDPNFALAHIARAAALFMIRTLAKTSDVGYVNALTEQARASTERAMELAPDLAIVHDELSTIALRKSDFHRAEAEITRARELAPGDSRILADYGDIEVYFGHTARGVEAAEQAAALNPLSPSAYGWLAWTLFAARRYDDGLAAVRHRQLLGGQPSGFWSALTGFLEYHKGDAEAARQSCSDQTDWQEHECLALAFHALGRQPEADAQLATLRALMGDTRAADYADIYAQWGNTAEALRWLETAYRMRDATLFLLKADPDLDPIRDQPRYKDIERKLDFPT